MAAALLNFERAVQSDPGFADAHFNLAMALHDIGREREARTHWETYLRLDPQSSWAEIARRHMPGLAVLSFSEVDPSVPMVTRSLVNLQESSP